MNIIETYKTAIGYITDLELINSNIEKIVSSKDNAEFEEKLLNLMKQLAFIRLRAEYYYKGDYCTEQYLVVETGYNPVIFPEIETDIGYDYIFSRGYIGNEAYYVEYQNIIYENLKEVKEKIIIDMALAEEKGA